MIESLSWHMWCLVSPQTELFCAGQVTIFCYVPIYKAEVTSTVNLGKIFAQTWTTLCCVFEYTFDFFHIERADFSLAMLRVGIKSLLVAWISTYDSRPTSLRRATICLILVSLY